jgi:micrococcal nuclease
MRLLIIGLLLVPFYADAAATYGNVTVSRVVSIHDGDTFTANIDGWPDVIGRGVPVRVCCIDTPELRAKLPLARLRAILAKRYTVGALRSARRVELVDIRRDKYFRILARVVADGQDLGEGLVRSGLAVPYDGGHKD